MRDDPGDGAPVQANPVSTLDAHGTAPVPPAPNGALPPEEIGRLTDEIVAALKSVYDPEIPADVYELGLIYKIDIGDDRAISMRLLEPSFRKVIYARSEGLDWRPLVTTQLCTLGRKEDSSRRIDARANELRLLHEAIERFPRSVGDQQSFWSHATSKSRASFFRLLARHRSN